MDFSKLTYGQIQSLAEELNSSASQMESLLSEIRGLFGRVGTDEVWNGTAAATTKARFDELSAKFPEFSKAVHDCSTYLVTAVENYQSVDNMVTGQ